MKKRSENCWLMQSRIVAAVATISVQRQKPLQRADAGDFSFVQAGGRRVRVVEDDLLQVRRLAAAMLRDRSRTLSTSSAPGSPVPISYGCRSEAARHAGFRKRRGARLHPAVHKFLGIGRRVGLVVISPGGGQRLLALVAGRCCTSPGRRSRRRLPSAPSPRPCAPAPTSSWSAASTAMPVAPGAASL